MHRVEIRVKGHLNQQWSDWFDGLALLTSEQGETLLTGTVLDQSALYGLVGKLRDLGLPLISIDVRQEPNSSDQEHEPKKVLCRDSKVLIFGPPEFRYFPNNTCVPETSGS